ncbi:MAG: hypothetical protein O4803_11295, partial [Trichodesmium sp. St15_bin1_1]|nr:hypothetical protein [Trichodesmium sp. St15_bin1_1]
VRSSQAISTIRSIFWLSKSEIFIWDQNKLPYNWTVQSSKWEKTFPAKSQEMVLSFPYYTPNRSNRANPDCQVFQRLIMAYN